MRRFRIIDDRKTEAAALYPLAVKARPYSIHEDSLGSFTGIPGAVFATKKEARERVEVLKGKLDMAGTIK